MSIKECKRTTASQLLALGPGRGRPLAARYPVVFFDALRVTTGSDGRSGNQALGIQANGQREVLGLWGERIEGARFWLKAFNDLKADGVEDIRIAVVDGLKGLAAAINTTYPHTVVQTCIVHLIRNSLARAGWKDRKLVAQDLEPICTAVSEEAALVALQAFAASPRGAKYPSIIQSWQRAWEHPRPFFTTAPDIRRMICTTNAIRSLNAQMRQMIQNECDERLKPARPS